MCEKLKVGADSILEVQGENEVKKGVFRKFAVGKIVTSRACAAIRSPSNSSPFL